MENIRIQVWRNRIKQGYPLHKILDEACTYEGHLDAMTQTEGVEREIREVVIFIKEISALVDKENNNAT